MANDWILDVLADLKTYADKNGLAHLARQLDDTILVAATEVASSETGAPSAAVGHAGAFGGFHRAHGRGRNAG